MTNGCEKNREKGVKKAKYGEFLKLNMRKNTILSFFPHIKEAWSCTFGIFNGGICCSRWYVVTLGEQLEMMNQCFHRCFHFRTSGSHNFGIVNTDFTSWHLIQTLFDDIQRLPHFFHTTQVSTTENICFSLLRLSQTFYC